MRKLCLATVLALTATVAIWGWRKSQPPQVPLAAPSVANTGQAGTSLPALNAPVNDFANVIDQDSATVLDDIIQSLRRDTGDVVVVATLPDCGSLESIKACSMKLFENHGRGIGQRGKDNGVLVLAVMKSREARITLGYGIESIISGQDATAIVETMTPFFRTGRFGAGFRTGVQDIVSRIRLARAGR
jgi:uncharacterized protein